MTLIGIPGDIFFAIFLKRDVDCVSVQKDTFLDMRARQVQWSGLDGWWRMHLTLHPPSAIIRPRPPVGPNLNFSSKLHPSPEPGAPSSKSKQNSAKLHLPLEAGPERSFCSKSRQSGNWARNQRFARASNLQSRRLLSGRASWQVGREVDGMACNEVLWHLSDATNHWQLDWNAMVTS